ncbi:malto-oligosyltrehalose trehalohydrolase [Salegentibacter chungangensis]|uniref:Malto-oligosyltrehalose trehalohydrolase n=1 Tax=Salegentibacter chungangensis TaxID=1335724 RepID=A0ABW3NPT6_9FLAO
MERILGPHFINDGCSFTVWAPFAEKIRILLKNSEKPITPEMDKAGYWEVTLKNIEPGTLYKIEVDGESYPDPASRSQPHGVHSWSEVVSEEFSWDDESWIPPKQEQLIIYELHTGTFSTEGNFSGIQKKLDHLKELGINCIEIMPIARFPGNRNWGYDGVYPFAVQESYGGRGQLKELINEAHKKGIAVILDVVYNHMGPEGNYLSLFGPYFTSKYETPWGQAMNFDDEYSDEVCNFFIQNAKMWLGEFHFDGLRLDAVHEIIDSSAIHFLRQLSYSVKELERDTGKKYFLIAESDRNDRRTIDNYSNGGYALEGQWTDDFHHSVHTLLTSEKDGYYSDFGKLWCFNKALKQAFVYDGIYSEHRKRTVGIDPEGLAPEKFVVCVQNHDQVGNRMLGERLSDLVSFEAQKLAAGILLVSPYVPMLFMGEEFAESNPFLYFVSHGDKELIRAVQEGRKREFKYFLKQEGDFPDPQAEETFLRSRLNWNFKEDPFKACIFEYYMYLIKLRKEAAFKELNARNFNIEASEDRKLLNLTTNGPDKKLYVAINFERTPQTIKIPATGNSASWKKIIASAEKKWKGPLSFPDAFKAESHFELPPTSILVYKT